MALDNPPQLYVIFMGGGPDQASCRIFGPYYEAQFQNQLKRDTFELWVRKEVDRPTYSRLATRIDGVWQLHDGQAQGSCSPWHWLSVKQMTPEQARQIGETEGGSLQHDAAP